MPLCKKCSRPFPNRQMIDGKIRILSKRKYCLDCSTWGKHNTVVLHLRMAQQGKPTICRRCKKTYTYMRHSGSTVVLCNSCNATSKRFERKKKCVAYLGGKCCVCEYDACISAIDFHHLDPTTKSFPIAGSENRAWNVVRKELDKCVLLCCRCHREVEAGFTKIPVRV